ncbi:hypothetical protein SMGD1_0787 [Sulfurimonas gotlandica GD1]|uniref:Uncharacterized protein n=1 Tax=Sulfurimonas gotlandica (strain DSM 19862 / JCM 16533 / GD1) TaxID=929558 RepID=H1FX04_SULGG|nr:hypothetical protein [Sulfurimonas gotlandica]EHP29314.1 hypothetical protein SMGD1_0787 [Sulfurimonas gotlandica GD1]
MLDSVINNKEFTQLMQKHMQELIVHFFSKEQNFGILCKIEDALFEPALPKEIVSEFRPLTLFFLAGYTFETAHIQDNCLIFEAGFGAENFGSLVRVPLVSIMQIIVDETPVMINLATHKSQEKSNKISNPKGVKDSMASFLSNPENSRFVKDKN